MDLTYIGGNINKGHHKFEIKGQVGLNKIGKSISNGNTNKVWVPNMQQNLRVGA